MGKILTLLSFVPLLSSGQQTTTDVIRFAFFSGHDMTNYHYIFYNDRRFKSNITGHLGDEGETLGTYLISNDTIYITPLPGKKQTNKYYDRYNQKFLIDGDTCIIDLANSKERTPDTELLKKKTN